VINTSWGDDEYSLALQDAVTAAEEAGILCSSSAGNDNQSIETSPMYPASYTNANVIGVAATTQTDARWYNPSTGYGSNYGAVSVDLGAPGVDIYSTTKNNAYASSTGTSRSAPIVAGAAALLWGIKPEATVGEIKTAILDGVDPVSSMAGKTVTGGRLNLFGAAKALQPGIEHAPLENTTNTIASYSVEAFIDPPLLLNTNRILLLWNTDGSTNSFTTNAMTHVTNNLYRAEIPAHPRGTTVSYYLFAETTYGKTRNSPDSAPVELHSFDVAGPVVLTVTGIPVNVGEVVPAYGQHVYASGSVVHAYAPTVAGVTLDTRLSLAGWEGSGNVPEHGESYAFSFIIATNSALQWRWTLEHSLLQTSSVAGVMHTSTWWAVSSTGQTVRAPARTLADGTNLCFTGWLLDGLRQPDATNRALNPLVDVRMPTSRVAEAEYMPCDVDADSDGMADWWEHFFLGSTNAPPDGNADKDGHDNLAEFRAGTDPRDAASVLALTALGSAVDGSNLSIVIHWSSASNRFYDLLATETLTNAATWSAVDGGSNLPGTGEGMSYSGAVDRAFRFFRVQTEKAGD